VAPGAHCIVLCAPGATSGKLLFLGRFGGPGAPAPPGGRQGAVGPVPVHFGRDRRAEAPPGAGR